MTIRKLKGTKDQKHLALTTGQIACSQQLTASYRTDAVTEDWNEVKCPKCKKTEFYQYRIAEAERGRTRDRGDGPR